MSTLFANKRPHKARKAILAGAVATTLISGAALTVGNGNAAVVDDQRQGLVSVFRLNVGGGAYTDTDGRTWQGDAYFEGGGTNTVVKDIAGTSNDALFQSERWGATGYDVPAANGSYQLRLLFAELNPTSGARVFSVSQGSRSLLSNFNIAATAGAYTAVWRTFDVQVTDGFLHLDLAATSNSTTLSALELMKPLGSTPTVPGPVTTPAGTPTPTPTSPTTAPTSPSGESMPKGDLPGFKQIFTDDFATPVGLGSFPGSAYGAKWDAYDNFKDSFQTGQYSKSKVLSVKDGKLDMYIHTENGVPMVAAPAPTLSAGKPYGGMSYGRWSVRFRSDSLPGYKTAWLLWPDSNVWNDGEIDFPEGGLDSTMNAFQHCTGANPQNNCYYVTNTGARYTDWHTATIEWVPGKVSFILDGKVLGSSTKSVPVKPMHWVLQTETGGGKPAASTAGHVEIDWVSVWAKV